MEIALNRRKRPRSVDAVVVGAGPAGLAAAVQLTRQGIDTVVFEKDRPGGQVATANLVENYLGLYRLPGAEIARLFVRHALNAGVRIRNAEVLGIRNRGRFLLRTTMGPWKARAVVLATGAVPVELAGAPPSVQYDTRAMEDFKGKRTVILGGGDAAFDRALRVNRVSSSVTVICRGKPSALPLLLDRCRESSITVVTDGGEPVISRGGGVIEVRTRKGSFCADVLVASIGKRADASGLLGTRAPLEPAFPDGHTRVPGLYVIGDLASGRHRYLSVATAMGVAAAEHATDFIRKGRGKTAKEGYSWK